MMRNKGAVVRYKFTVMI